MPRRYPPEFRRTVLELIASGRRWPMSRDLGVSGQTIHDWRKQDLIDRVNARGLRSPELAEIASPTPSSSRSARMQAELLDRRRWKTRVEHANAIFEYIEVFHNSKRWHSSLRMHSPIEFEKTHTHPSAVA